MYDVVSESEESGDEGRARRANQAGAREGTRASKVGAEDVALTANQIASVKDVTDDALVEVAERYRGAHTQIRALTTPVVPGSRTGAVKETDSVVDGTSAIPMKTSPTKAADAPATATPIKLETFDDVFSMFTGSTNASAPCTTHAPATRQRGRDVDAPASAADAFVNAARHRERVRAGDATPTRAVKPKISFAALMAETPRDEDAE